MVQIRQPTIDRALSLVEEEIGLVETEREAFERFLGRLRDVQSGGVEGASPATGGGPTALQAGEATPADELRQIRCAYRETVMAVPHYEDEYGDTLRESLAEELGATLASHVVDGQVLTPGIHDALVGVTEQVRDDRAGFLRQLRRERESLGTVAEELNEVEARLMELDDRIAATTRSTRLAALDETLERLERRCADLATRRQEQIHDSRAGQLSGVDAASLAGYLYGDMETDTPALTDIAARLDAVQKHRARCLR
jgi:hypothetical protein